MVNINSLRILIKTNLSIQKPQILDCKNQSIKNPHKNKPNSANIKKNSRTKTPIIDNPNTLTNSWRRNPARARTITRQLFVKVCFCE